MKSASLVNNTVIWGGEGSLDVCLHFVRICLHRRIKKRMLPVCTGSQCFSHRGREV